MIHPHELANFEIALDSMKELIRISKNEFKEDDNNFDEIYYFEDYQEIEFERFLKSFNETFKIDLMRQFCLNDITQSFFKKGIKPNLDKIQEKIEEKRNYFEEQRKYLSSLLDKSTEQVKFESNERDGYFLRTTVKRGLDGPFS